MRILQISSVKKFGGGERHLVDLAKGLHSRGHDVFTCLRPHTEWKDRLSFLPAENLFELPLLNSFDIFSAYKIAAFIRQRNIEIIHAHAARDYPIAAIAARIAKIKLILTRHLLFGLNPLHKFILPGSVTFIGVTRSVRDRLLEQNLASPEQIHLIYNGIDTFHFQTTKEKTSREELLEELNLPVDASFVGIVGEIAEHKGQIDFVRAAAMISQEFPSTEFLIIGREGANKAYRERLENLIRESGLKNRVHFLGAFENMAPVFSVLDVFVSASHFESFGLAIVEAMASGIAVVAAETEGAKEIIKNNETGKLVPLKHPASIARAVNGFLRDENIREIFGVEAQKAAIEKFDIKRMILETEETYKKGLELNKK